MPKLLILEGVDSTGKTSLAKWIARELRASYHHASGHITLHYAMNAHHQSIVHDALVNFDNVMNVVIDRLWPSELAYAPILRPQAAKLYDLNKIMGKIARMEPTYIYCHSDGGFERYEETHKDHDRTAFRHLTKKEYHDIAARYEAIFADLVHHRYSIEEHGMRQAAFLDEVLK